MTPTFNPKTKLLLLATISLFLIAGLATSANAAAFNCSDARQSTELLICRSPELGKIDELNSYVFYKVRNALPQSQLHSFNVAQRAWIAERNYCGYDEDCVKASYHLHIVDLCARATELGLDTCADDNAAPAVAAVPTGKCKVTDPSSTALNYRSSPNGTKIGTLPNGLTVEAIELDKDSNGMPWMKIKNSYSGETLGWVWREFVSCWSGE